MCLADLWTDSRGRSTEPATFLRSRKWRRPLASRRAVETSLPARLCLTATVSATVLTYSVSTSLRRSLTRLPDLGLDALARVAHALALVRVGLAQLADVGGDLADLLLVDALHRKPGRRLDDERDALGRGDLHRVRVTERELQVAAPQCDAVTDAVDLHLLLIALGDPDHHVAHQRSRQPVQGTRAALVVGPAHQQRAVLATLDGDRLGDPVRQRAPRAVDRHVGAIDVDVDADGNEDRQLSDS